MKFNVHVKKVQVANRKIKHEDTRETPAHYETIRVGTLTVEFDADDVNVDEIASMISDMQVPVDLGGLALA